MNDSPLSPASTTPAALPPGQRAIDFFPRFGRRTDKPPPTVTASPTVTIGGALDPPFEMTVEELVDQDRREVRADFHCVAGWSVTDLRWEGIPFAEVYQRVIAPRIAPTTTITHVAVRGLDGEHFVAELADLLVDNVVLADRLNGQALDGDHGAPLRLVSPAQYGYANIKHVCRVDVLTGPPTTRETSLLHRLLASHPRARVWQEERHPSVPGWLIRPAYRMIKVALLATARRRQGP